MTTRLKTIEFATPQLNTLADNTLTALTQITMYIPEFSGTVTIRKAIIRICSQEGATQVTGNYNSRRIDVSVGGAGATSYTNAIAHNGAGQLTSEFYAADATAHFATNWASGTTKTLDISVLIDHSGATVALRNVSATIRITFEYDDTQTTQIKTIRIPLDAPVGALATSKPGSATATIPNLDTELPEASKVYRNMFITVQGNVTNTGSTVDSTLSMQIDALTAYTSQTLEMGTTSDYWTRFIFDITGLGMTTNATHSFYLWASVARHNHQQAWLTVTYEFDASAANDIFVSLMIPQNLDGIIGGVTSADYQRLETELWIQEPGSITTKQVAFYFFWEAVGAMAGLNMRVGTGGFVTYTDTAAVFCGSNGAMCRNDAAFSLARGRNTLTFDVYRTDTTDLGFCPTGFWIINYTADKPSQGYGAANHTVFWNLGATFDGNFLIERTLTATAPIIPETEYFINSLGVNLEALLDSSTVMHSVEILVDRVEDQKWLQVYCERIQSDAETGLRKYYADAGKFFYRWAGDPDPDRLNIETNRRWKILFPLGFYFMAMVVNYHSITYAIAGTLTNFGAGTVDITAVSEVSKEVIAETSRLGNGAYSMTWYDNTEDVKVIANQDSTHMGASDIGTAA
jgi:hypothetical protein